MNCNICNRLIDKTKAIKYKDKIYCAKHYQQMLKFGHALDTNQKITKDLNDFIIKGNIVEVITINTNCKECGRFIIDISDLEKVMCKKWRVWKNRVYTGNRIPINLSKFLLQESLLDNDLSIEYINSNPLDNTRKNLRIVK